MKLICYLLITTVLFSCKKESAVVFPQTLYANKITKKTKARLFTNKVEIFNTAVIDNFISNYASFNIDTYPIDSNEQLKFVTKDSAIFGTGTEKFFIVKTGNQFIFNSRPMIVSYNPLDELFKYTGERQPMPFNRYLTSFQRVGYGSYTNLDITILSYKWKNGNFTEVSGTESNELNENFITKMRPTDTLAIQEFKYNFKVR